MGYRVNSPHVISETVSGETIVVNLASGHYFSFDGTAVEIWEALERAESGSAIVDRLKSRYEGDEEEMTKAVASFISDLQAEELISAADVDDTPAAAAPPTAYEGERQPFVAPTFTRFTDMQDIILLDPVHEVDARGWPHTSVAP